jgi:hypothetical protein
MNIFEILFYFLFFNSSFSILEKENTNANYFSNRNENDFIYIKLNGNFIIAINIKYTIED